MFRRLFCWIPIVAFLLLLCPARQANADDARITGTFNTLGVSVSWEYPYSDAFFSLPSDRYDHSLARLSLGLALAAFRDGEHADAQDDCLIDFLERTGFHDIETGTYRTPPSTDSISYGFAFKKLEGATVIACAVCGGHYGPEWASNLTIGDEEQAVGFRDSAQKVEDALSDYLRRHSFHDSLKLWISGYSRGSAVANITAADSTDSGLFTDVYAYCFATPRTTREPGEYGNIFNILGKNDPVPKIPFVDWGYSRYGTDMYLRARETDIDSSVVLERVAELYREMTGSDMVSNPEISYHLRTMLNYLLTLMPDSASYSAYLQPLLVDILSKDTEAERALLILLEALDRFSLKVGNREELQTMREYLKTLVEFYYSEEKHENTAPEQWDAHFGPLNLFHDHFPFRYLAGLFASDEPSEVFSDQTEYIRLVIYGDVDVEISDGEKILKTVSGDGREAHDRDTNPYSVPNVEHSARTFAITLPADRSIQIRVLSNAVQTVTYTGTLFSENSVRAKDAALYSYLMGGGDTALITTASNGRIIDSANSDYTDISRLTGSLYSPTAAMRLKDSGRFGWTISDFLNRSFLLLLFLIVSVIMTILFLAIRKNRKLTAAAALILHGINVVLFAALELVSWYCFPMLPHIRLIQKCLVCTVLLLYSLAGCIYCRDNGRWKRLLVFILVLILYEAAESLLLRVFTPLNGGITAIAYLAFLSTSCLLFWRDPGAAAAADTG